MPIQIVKCAHGHIGQMWFSDTPGMKHPPYVCRTCGALEAEQRRTVTIAQGRNAGAFNMAHAAQTALPGSLDVLPSFTATPEPQSPPSFESGGGGDFGGGGASDSF